MRLSTVFIIVLICNILLPPQAFAHFGFADGEDPGHGIFWAYGIVFTALLSFVFYRRWSHNQLGTPEERKLKLKIRELERALNSCLKQIKNADAYPNECALSEEQRNENLTSAKSIQKEINLTKEMLSTI